MTKDDEQRASSCMEDAEEQDEDAEEQDEEAELKRMLKELWQVAARKLNKNQLIVAKMAGPVLQRTKLLDAELIADTSDAQLRSYELEEGTIRALRRAFGAAQAGIGAGSGAGGAAAAGPLMLTAVYIDGSPSSTNTFPAIAKHLPTQDDEEELAAFYNLRPFATSLDIAPPVRLMFAGFGLIPDAFYRGAEEGKLPARWYEGAHGLCDFSARVLYGKDKENVRQHHTLHLLAELWPGVCFFTAYKTDGSCLVEVSWSSPGFMVAIIEFKDELHASGDAPLQCQRYVQDFYAKKSPPDRLGTDPVLRATGAPVLVMTIAGPNLGVYGAYLKDVNKVVCEPLVPLLQLLNLNGRDDGTHISSIAHVLAACYASLLWLKDIYMASEEPNAHSSRSPISISPISIPTLTANAAVQGGSTQPQQGGSRPKKRTSSGGSEGLPPRPSGSTSSGGQRALRSTTSSGGSAKSRSGARRAAASTTSSGGSSQSPTDSASTRHLPFSLTESNGVFGIASMRTSVLLAFHHHQYDYEALWSASRLSLEKQRALAEERAGWPWPLPYPLRNSEVLVDIKPLRVAHKLLFSAQLRAGAGGCERASYVLIKFSSAYPAQIHYAWAREKLAPELVACTPLPGGLSMVVMEHLRQQEGWHMLCELEQNRDEQRIAFAAAEAALNRAHKVRIADSEYGAVHGDVRGPNIMVKEDQHVQGGWQVRFVDLDWAGVQGSAFYPKALLNAHALGWHDEACAGQPMQQYHDTYLLQKLGKVGMSK
eukprot:TRINITY_DN3140_c0_g1_i4.p1 TRINITY_DN3140_c0_g1~~TRINITY_DN3140_c0_g1_i4.p1  ORF type:complete len:764 (-),score=144.64 TRINITY_DN3140_c0_g1_i4:112-2403(-)